MKNKKIVSFTLSLELIDYLRSKSEETGIKMSTIVEKALISFRKEKQ